MRQIAMPITLQPLIKFPVFLISLCLLKPFSLFFELSDGFHHLLILFLKRLSFQRCNGVWGEEALENYARGFYVCDGGIDRLRAHIASSAFFFS